MASFLMFLSSYSPLFAILGVQFFAWPIQSAKDYAWIVFVVLCIAGVIGFLYTINYYRKATAQTVKVKETHISGGQAVGYLSGYLLPFIAVNGGGWKMWIAYAIFFLVTYEVTVRTDVIQINPLFFIFHYHLYATDVEYESATGKVSSMSTILISKKPLVPGQRVKSYAIGQSIRICG
ncbi:MAG: hypothetical protein LKI34_07750 [Bifidobacterium tibiigranuli]|jgi:hypothetical protein|uniref:hypothetical protein n=1 Tax=Bifidobacterium tibiigranuli TaxID=2172043 RepID=UPI0026F31068|nr:hypothetical protein [Bifidobacterium tibiigranuli]MCI1674091.1 hypothetical protein [Bifidobacterium tibiigranuli]MCI1712856.1 hypothetical protein [Bifidobacterium tibiigranuli]MCI1834171.1 hypothetical protein [Bifidobacterium tibiigranuli]